MADPIGSLANDIASLFDTAPKVPEAPNVNVQDEQRKAIQGNITNLPYAEQLAAKTNAFNYDQLHEQLSKAIPGYEDLIKQQGNVLSSMLRGEIPQDVQNAIQRNSAVKSLYGGYGGSGAARNLTARDLGLTSLDLTGRALDSASRWMANTKALTNPGQFNVAALFISPEQQIQNEWANKTSQFQRDWTSNQVVTAEDNRMHHAWANTGADVVNLALAAYGGGMGGMGGAAGAAGGASGAGASFGGWTSIMNSFGGGNGGTTTPQ